MPEVKDPRLLQRLNTPASPSGGMVQIAPGNPTVPGQIQGQGLSNAEKAATLPYAAPKANADLTKTRSDIQNVPMDRADTLAKRFEAQDAVKQYRAVAPIFMSGLKAANDSGGDLDLLYAYAKVMDPGSVVRESEQENAKSNVGYWDAKVADLKKQFGDSSGGLSQKTRDFLRRGMNTKAAELAKAYGVQRSDYQRIAQQRAVDPFEVVGSPPLSGQQIEDYKRLMHGSGFTLRDEVVTAGAGGAGPDQIDPTGGNPLLSPQDRDFLSKNARSLGPDGVRQYVAARGLRIPESEIQQAFDYYAKGGQQSAQVNVPQGAGSTLGRVGAGPVGAYFGGVMNGLVPGMSDEVAAGVTALAGGDFNSALNDFNTRKQAMADANPMASIIGNVTGGAATMALPGAALSRLGVGAGSASTLAPRLLAEDALYGAAYGAGEQNNDRLSGGLSGMIEGMAGGVIGRGAIRGAGHALAGAKGAASAAPRFLREQGVPMTIPQMIGGRLKSREDRLMGFQGIGNRIAEQRLKGMEGLNSAAWRQVYDTAGEVPPGVIGEEGVDAFRAARSKLYGDALDGKNFQLDPAFEQEMTAAKAVGGKLPELGDQFGYTVGKAEENIDNGAITGKGVQAAFQRLRKDKSRFASNPRGDDFGDALSLVEQALASAAGRSDPTVIPALEKANRFYREGSILKDATGAARNAGGVFTPSQLTNAAEKSARKFGGTESSTDRPFFELSRAAQQVLPSAVPDSGTAGRQATSLTRDLIRELINAPMYAEPAQKAVGTMMFAPRPAQMERAGDILVNKAAYPAGSLASLLALQYGQ